MEYTSLLNENNTFKKQLCQYKEDFFEFMVTMGKYPMYPFSQQLSLHNYADGNITMYAPLSFWRKNNLDIVPEAAGVPVINELTHGVDLLYSVNDVNPEVRDAAFKYYNWDFNFNNPDDAALALEFFRDTSQGDDITSRVLAEARKHTASYMGENNEFRNIIEVGIAYAILSRFGYETDKILQDKVDAIKEVNFPYIISGRYFSIINKAVKEIVTPIRNYKWEIKRGAENHVDRTRDLGDGRHPGRGVSVSGETVRQNEDGVPSVVLPGKVDENAGGGRPGRSEEIPDERGGGIQQSVERPVQEEYNREPGGSGNTGSFGESTGNQPDKGTDTGEYQRSDSADRLVSENSPLEEAQPAAEEPVHEDTVESIDSYNADSLSKDTKTPLEHEEYQKNHEPGDNSDNSVSKSYPAEQSIIENQERPQKEVPVETSKTEVFSDGIPDIETNNDNIISGEEENENTGNERADDGAEVSLGLEIPAIKMGLEDLTKKLKGYASKDYQGNKKAVGIYAALHSEYLTYQEQFEKGLTDPFYFDGYNLNTIRRHLKSYIRDIQSSANEDFSSMLPDVIPDNYMVIDNPANTERTLNRLKRTIFDKRQSIFVKGEKPGELIERNIDEVIAELEARLQLEQSIENKQVSERNDDTAGSAGNNSDSDNSVTNKDSGESESVSHTNGTDSNKPVLASDLKEIQKEKDTEELRKTIVDYSAIDYQADMASIKGKRAVFQRNLAAIKLVKFLDTNNLEANEQELNLLRSYAGFGGIPEAFDSFNTSWQKEHGELLSILSDSEYKAARASSLNAHYTPNVIIQSIYAGLEKTGFEGGNIIEPSCGSGRFFDNMPSQMRSQSNIFGVELDEITSKIASRINPDITISNQGFETTKFPDNSFDLAISNIPYGDYRITADKKYAGQNLLIHDYFLEKMMDQVRPGGYVVAITSKGSLDKHDARTRKYLAARGELVSAIRLPEETFNAAGTEAVADILIFKKHEDGIVKEYRDPKDYTSKNPPYPDWVYSLDPIPDNRRGNYSFGFDKNNFPKDYYDNRNNYVINNYFADHHKNILGNPCVKSSAHGNIVSYLQQDDISIPENISEIFGAIPEEQHYKKPGDTNIIPPRQQFSNTEGQNTKYGYRIDENGSIAFTGIDGEIDPLPALSDKQKEKLVSLVQIREALLEVLHKQTLSCSDEELHDLQNDLTQKYDAHVKKYGPLFKDRDVKKLFIEDPSYSLIRSLEILDDEGNNIVGRADIFTKRTFIPHNSPNKANSMEEALIISVQETGKIDFPYIQELTGASMSNVIEELENTSIYYNPENGEYEIAEQYLSGDIRSKIEFVESRISDLEKEKERIINSTIYKEALTISVPEPPYSHPLEEIICTAYKNKQPIKVSGYELKQYFLACKESSPIAKDVYLMGLCCMTLDTEYDVRSDAIDDPRMILHLMKYVNNMGSHNLVVDYSAAESYLLDLIREIPIDIKVAHRFLNQVILNEKLNNPYDQAMAAKLCSFLEKELDNFPKPIKDIAIAEDWKNFEAQSSDLAAEESKNESVAALEKEIQKLNANLAALEKVRPRDLYPEEINIQLGATWINPEIIKQFLVDTLELPYSTERSLHIRYSPVSSNWDIQDAKNLNVGVKGISTYGTQQCNALELCEMILNLKPAEWKIKVLDDYGNERIVIDPQMTMLLRLKQDEIKKAFSEWLTKQPKISQELANYYNRHYNNIRPREYNGDNLIFPEMNPEIKLEKHQKDAIAHTLYGGNTLLAHCVGAGKTFEMIAAIMESKRLGLSHKALMVVPNHLTVQTGTEFLRLYPNAKILMATKEDFQKDRRKSFFAKMATQNWDAIIIGASQFERIPLSPEYEVAFLQKTVNQLIDALDELKGNTEARWSIKQIESTKKKLEARITKICEENQTKKDNISIYFEELGIDKLCIDEAHYFKNLYIASHMTNVAGINTSNSKRADDLYKKCCYLNETTNHKGVVFATGTPVSNSMTELYTMQRFLQPDKLSSAKLTSFDSWAANFGQTVVSMELKPEGKGYQEKTRFAKFFNLPELMNMFKECADIRTADMLPNLKVPESELIVEKALASKIQRDIVNELSKRAERIRKGGVDPKDDNMLLITNTGRLAALDPRALNPHLPDDPDSKVNKCVSNILEIYRDTTPKKSAQVVFSDLSTPSGDKSWNVYEDIKNKLVKAGIPGKEIAFIQDYDTDVKKQKLFDKVNKGEVRVIFGSTSMLGVGTNIQQRLIAAHMIDTLWKPADFEQRIGRIVRRNNENDSVKIYQYITESTFDAYMWQTMEHKQKFISQIMTSKSPSREATDCDEQVLTFAEIKAIATGNPLIKEKMEVENELSKISIARNKYFEEKKDLQYRLNKIFPKRIAENTEIIEQITEDLRVFQENAPASKTDDNGNRTEDFQIVLCGIEYHSKAEAAEAFKKLFTEKGIENIAGKFHGLDFKITFDFSQEKYNVRLSNKSSYKLTLTATDNLPFLRMEKLDELMQSKITAAQEKITFTEKDIEVAQKELNSTFNMEERYKELTSRSMEITKILEEQDKPVATEGIPEEITDDVELEKDDVELEK